MVTIAKIIKSKDKYLFYCPGCEREHAFDSTWRFNNDYEKPTVTPSVLVQYPWGKNKGIKRCHSFIADGKLHYLTDCSHSLAGQTVGMAEIDMEQEVWEEGEANA